MAYLIPALAALLAAFDVCAVPYRIPSPSQEVCTNDAVFDELSQKLGDGTLHSEEDLLASLDFVEKCETYRYQKKPNHRP